MSYTSQVWDICVLYFYGHIPVYRMSGAGENAAMLQVIIHKHLVIRKPYLALCAPCGTTATAAHLAAIRQCQSVFLCRLEYGIWVYYGEGVFFSICFYSGKVSGLIRGRSFSYFTVIGVEIFFFYLVTVYALFFKTYQYHAHISERPADIKEEFFFWGLCIFAE